MPDCPLAVDPARCLELRFQATNLRGGDPRAGEAWRLRCVNCSLGRERRMASFTPEPDELKQPYRRNPTPCSFCGTIVQVPGVRKVVLCKPCYFSMRSANAAARRITYKCKACGGKRTRDAVLCDPCYRASRRLPGKCRQSNCTNKARRRGFCRRHARERLIKSQGGYREKGGRIFDYERATK